MFGVENCFLLFFCSLGTVWTKRGSCAFMGKRHLRMKLKQLVFLLFIYFT